MEETGTTFEENALLKAREVPSAPALSPLPTIRARSGCPQRRTGVYSARYSEDMPDLPSATRTNAIR
ncbi:MAG: hypothetical protein ACLRWP_00395 [Bilophila wadsworthia]